jgi:two-component system, chemotaxis family, sensor kinase CheA
MSNTDKYKKLYLDEAKEKITDLNSALLALEQDPLSNEIANNAMRASHTLKSSSAAMGYMETSNLAHTMEDFFETVRTRKHKLSQDAMQLLFDSADAFSAAAKAVSENKPEPSTEDLIKKLTTIQQPQTPDPSLKKKSESSIVNQAKAITFDPITSIKVNTEVLDTLMNLTEELLVEKMRLQQITANLTETYQDLTLDLRVSVENIDRLISDLQYNVTETHMVPLGQIFERFPRIIRDLAKDTNKEIKFEAMGQDIELDRTMLDRLGEPLIHLLRNAVDHGIDKDGTIQVHARRERDRVLIEVENTGHSIDWTKVVKVAVKKGIISEKQSSQMSVVGGKPSKALEELLYHPEFSTKDHVTEVSGRGVGLAIVKSVIESVGGKVLVESDAKYGTKFILSLPLTIAIVQALLVRAGNNIFALPFAQADRLVRVPYSGIKKAMDQEIAVVEEQDVPMVRLDERFHLNVMPDKMLDKKKQRGESELMVITRNEDKNSRHAGDQLGIVVDEVFSEQDIVVKPLSGILKQTKGFAGVTLLGDGRPALILDIATLF